MSSLWKGVYDKMRNLMFRAWDKEKKKWIDGAYGFHILGEAMLIGGLFHDYSIEDLNNIIIEQFTGLLDKNGKEIYEGDIVEYFQYSQVCSKCAHRDKNVNEVKFNALGVTLSSYRIIDPQSDITEIEIIGNVHTHPELLSERK